MKQYLNKIQESAYHIRVEISKNLPFFNIKQQ
jgi:hypothetical protein